MSRGFGVPLAADLCTMRVDLLRVMSMFVDIWAVPPVDWEPICAVFVAVLANLRAGQNRISNVSVVMSAT